MLSLWLLAAHMVGDYVVQNDWMAANKFKDPIVRAVHVFCYNLCFVPVILMHGRSPEENGMFAALNCLTHFIVDSRRWASGEKWPPKPILVDQTLHICCLATLGSLFLVG